MRRQRFALVGHGAVGMSLARALLGAGHRCVAVYGRDARRAAQALRRLAPRDASSGDRHDEGDFDLLVIAVPDRAIAEVARSWAGRTAWKGKFAFHTSGALASSVLAPLRRRGARVGTLHPLTSLPSGGAGARAFHDVSFGIEGGNRALRMAAELVKEVGGSPLVLRPGGRASYHLGACFASGYLLTLISLAAGLVARGGRVQRTEAEKAVLVLSRSSVRNAINRGLENALTGPLVRRDFATIERHLKALRRQPAELSELHRILVGRMSSLLVRSGRITRADGRLVRRRFAQIRPRASGRRGERKA